MSKLVFLKFGDGSFDRGFPMTLQIGDESADRGDRLSYQPLAETAGTLPANPELLQLYRRWQTAYRQLGLRSRLHARTQVTNVSVLQDCQQAAVSLGMCLNDWLRSESFRAIRETWLEQLSPQDSIRLILQSQDPQLQRLPWHLWELVERYSACECALSLPTYNRTSQTHRGETVKILAILGNSQGLDVQSDRLLLEQLPNAEVEFLVEPQRQVLNDRLWAADWNILFFAGHSHSEADASTGELKINATESLTIPQLKYALRKSVERGLKLAIFNSCDGLGLARNLADLHIPQMIVMREPVPDRVAQTFLRSFLEFFADGNSLYSAVRSAREKLQGLEDQFPCATWLPVICQNPAEPPIVWTELIDSPPIVELTEEEPAEPTGSPRRLAFPVGLVKALLIGLFTAAGVTAVRSIGTLQTAELATYDHLLRLRPAEQPDPRLLVVTIDEAERQTYGAELAGLGWISLSDRHLNQLLQRLETAQPRVIGLDLYRDFPVEANQASLATQFQQNSRLIAVCKARFTGGDSIAPPPDVPPDRVGFSDFVVDGDDTLRRHLMAMTPDLIDPGIPCTTPIAFSTQLAFHYLQAQSLTPTLNAEQNWQIQNVIFDPLTSTSGGYWRTDAQGNQMMLNYRMTNRPAPQVSLTELLSGQVNPELIRDRVVLVGVTADSTGDIWQTPIDSQMPGVLVQAHMVSQILSAVLDDRPLLWVWSTAGETVWIVGLALAGGMLAWFFRVVSRWLGILLLLSGGLVGLAWGMLILGGWLPLVPGLAALLIASGLARLMRWRLRSI